VRTQINSERKGVTHFTEKATELLYLKNSLFLSCDCLWKISYSGEFDLESYEQLKKGGMEEGNWKGIPTAIHTHILWLVFKAVGRL